MNILYRSIQALVRVHPVQIDTQTEKQTGMQAGRQAVFQKELSVQKS
jgi:hypothetical protein